MDHVIVLGAKDVNTIIDMRANDADQTQKISEMALVENYTLKTRSSFKNALDEKLMGDYKKGYNSSTAVDQVRPTSTTRTEYYYVPPINQSKRILLREVTSSYSADGDLVTAGRGETQIRFRLQTDRNSRGNLPDRESPRRVGTAV